MNDYAFADLVIDNASLERRMSATRIDYFVGRLTQRRRDQLACGKTLWTSRSEITFGDSFHGASVGNLYVLDVRACRATAVGR